MKRLVIMISILALAFTACSTDNDNDNDNGDNLTTLTINGLPPSSLYNAAVYVFTNGTDISTIQAWQAANNSHSYEAFGGLGLTPSAALFELKAYYRRYWLFLWKVDQIR